MIRMLTDEEIFEDCVRLNHWWNSLDHMEKGIIERFCRDLLNSKNFVKLNEQYKEESRKRWKKLQRQRLDQQNVENSNNS